MERFMTDMLVKLYELPPLQPALDSQIEQGITIRRALVTEQHLIVNWVKTNFDDYWESETAGAISRQPPSCFIAVENGDILGFGCYDTTAKGFFGPTGVAEQARGRGTGAALLLACLHDMLAQGYGYAIIGGVGPAEFYTKIAGATIIEGSSPGIYRGLLK
jgi:ribosomal protein S18 acetylase RimI-like enzyme